MVRRIDHTITTISDTSAIGDDRHHHRGLDAIALPGDRHIAGPVGEPDHAEGRERDQLRGKEGPGSSARRLQRGDGIGGQLAARRRSPCRALRPWRSRLAAARGRRRAACRARPCAPATLPCAARCSTRDRIAVRSSPCASSPTGRMRTSFSALACRRSRKPLPRGGLVAGAEHRAHQRGKLLAERGVARHARRRERLELRDSVGVGRQRLDDGKFGGERIAALGRAAQRRRRDREPRRRGRCRRRPAGRCCAHRSSGRRSLSMLALVSRIAASAASARRDKAATLSACDFAAFSLAVSRPSTTGSVTGGRGVAAAASSLASRAAMSSSVFVILGIGAGASGGRPDH